MADTTPPQLLTRSMGGLGASITAAFVLGPATGAAVADLGFATTSYLAAALAGANLMVAALVVPESLPPSQRAAHTVSPRSPATLLAVFRRRSSGILLLAGLCSTFAFASMEATFALLGGARFALGTSEVGWILAGAGACMVIVQGVGVHRIARQCGDRPVAVAGSLIMMVSLLGLPMLSLWGTVTTARLLCVGFSLVTPTLATLLIRSSGSTSRVATLGANQSAAAVARALGPACAGVLFDQRLALPYLAAAVVAAISAAALRLAAVSTARPRQNLGRLSAGPTKDRS
ncbi:MFS transporter [Pseudonocardia spinosispora]|uniref:MFS transporter n=1 Tax=Pseudonocardia spinosispora TaxID=103441 RepID=UPI000411E222|nr:MFS transporter [Pseudonocardia spinosispora]